MNVDPDLEPYTGCFEWEKHLTPVLRNRLALYRMVAADGDASAFALAYARDAWELAQELEDAGDDPAARAEVRALHEMSCYGFWLGADPDDNLLREPKDNLF